MELYTKAGVRESVRSSNPLIDLYKRWLVLRTGSSLVSETGGMQADWLGGGSSREDSDQGQLNWQIQRNRVCGRDFLVGANHFV